MKNNLIALNKKISNHQINNLYFFYGNEVYLINIYLKKIQKELLIDKNNQFSYLEFKNLELNYDIIIDFINTMPMFSKNKMLIIYDNFTLNNYLLEKFCNIPNNIYIILISKDKKCFDIFPKKMLNNENIYAFDTLQNKYLYNWIIKKFSEYNINIDIITCEYFIFCCKKSMYNLKNEINKIAMYVFYKKNIPNIVTINIINKLTNKVFNAKIFEIIDPIINGDYLLTFTLIKEFQHFGYDYMSIFNFVLSHFKKIHIIQLNNQASNDYLMKLINTKSLFYLNNIKNDSKRISNSIIKKILEILFTKELLLKKIKNKNIFIESTILTIINYFRIQ